MSEFTTKNIIKYYCGHDEITITDEDIEKLKSGIKLYTSVQDEYSISLEYKKESEFKITDNTNRKAYFGDLIKGDFLLSNEEIYIKTGENDDYYNCVRLSDGVMRFKGKLDIVMPVDVGIIITNRGEIKNEQTEQQIR